MDFKSFFNLCLENTATRSYSCLMLDLSFLKDDWDEIQKDICPCEVYDDEPGHGLETEPHITVKYGIHTEDADAIWDQLDLKPCSFKLSKVSLFENEKYDVLKFDVISDDLHKLNEEVCDKFEYTDKYKIYHPHSTICYLQPGSGEYYRKQKNKLIGKEFTSDKFIFSTGSGSKSTKTVK